MTLTMTRIGRFEVDGDEADDPNREVEGILIEGDVADIRRAAMLFGEAVDIVAADTPK